MTIRRLGVLLTPAQCRDVTERADALFQPARLHSQGRRNREAVLNWPELRATLEAKLPGATLGPRFECYRYEAGDSIDPHCDSPLRFADGTVSNFTLLVYLDESAAGGETLFPDRNVAIRPLTGHGLLFSQALRHAGGEVTSGRKHVLRVDVASSLDAEFLGPRS